ncbi:muscarinic acetylcholine receptor M2-like isoform X2 [Convolutriloba macropyga]
MDYTMCTSSCLSILVICIDRYWSLAYPISYRQYMSTWVVISLIIPTWVIPILLYGIGIFGVHQFGSRDVEDEKCYVHYYDEPVFTTVSTVINYWAIIVAILILYYKIYKITKFFWRKKKHRSAAHTPCSPSKPETVRHVGTPTNRQVADTSSDSEDSPESGDEKRAEKKSMIPKVTSEQSKVLDGSKAGVLDKMPHTALKVPNTGQVGKTSGLLLELPNLGIGNPDGDTSISPATTTSTALTSCSTMLPVDEQNVNNANEQLPISQGPKPKGNSKAMRVLTAVLSSFIICWTPYSVLVIVLSFDSSLVPNSVFYTTYGLCYLNSLFNPGLYAYANEVFRRTFWKILRCR